MTDTNVGDNREVSVVTSVAFDVTFYINHSNTSTSDTTSAKYFDLVMGPADQWTLRADKDCHIKEINGTELTDPITLNGDGSHTEKDTIRYYAGGLTTLKVTCHENTQLKLRVKQRSAE